MIRTTINPNIHALNKQQHIHTRFLHLTRSTLNHRSMSTTKPVLLFDIMDTIVKDPFYKTMPAFFEMEFQELLDAKHPTTWVEFEKGEITEQELFTRFFKDGRSFDSDALIKTIIHAYDYIDGMEDLLQRLTSAGYELHAFSNYPMWYKYIDTKLQLNKYLSWTYISCEGPMKGLRKPSIECYRAVIDHIQRPADEIIFIDDRKVNIDAAIDADIVHALQFDGSAVKLEEQLRNTKGLVF